MRWISNLQGHLTRSPFILTLALCVPVQQVAANTESVEIEQLKQQIIQLRQQIQDLSTQQKVMYTQSVEQHAQAPVNPAQNQRATTSLQSHLGDTQLRLYGSIRVDAAYDFKGSTRSIANKLGSQPLNQNLPVKNSLNVSAATTRLGVDVARHTDLGQLKAKIEADFMGTNGDNGDGSIRVRHAYVSLGHWLIGQTTSPFASPDTSPSLVDFTGALGTSTQRNVQIQYHYPFTAHQNILLALEGGDVERNNSQGGSRLPAMTMQYSLKTSKLLLQLHTLLHENRAVSAEGHDTEKWAWGVGLGAKYQFNARNTAFANVYHVVGDNRYLRYSKNNDAYDYDQGQLYFSAFNLAELGYIHQWNSVLKSSLSVGRLWFDSDSTYAHNHPEQNKHLMTASANVFWSPVQQLDLGLEYTYGQRTLFSGLDGDLSRLNMLARYRF